MGLRDLSRLNREHPEVFSLLIIFIISILVYNTVRDLVNYLLPFDPFWILIFLTVIAIMILLYLYEKEIL